ncbi:MAG: OmpA family protein [Chitinophagaceae bacterium]|nr:MAG: OmpA family protein [Chitinophagaceae bacterium]
MKQIILLAALAALTNGDAQAQLGKFTNKVKNKLSQKVNQRVDNRVDKTLDDGLDVVEGKKSVETVTEKKETPGSASPKTSVKSYSKFDFVPGEKIIYADDFTGEEMGQLPLNWNTQGKAELVTLEAAKGNWLRLFPVASYLTSNKEPFTKNFTVEFDLLLSMENTGYSYPYFSFGLMSSGEDDAGDNKFLDGGYRKVQSAEVYLRLSSGGTTSTYMESYDRGARSFITESQQLSALEANYGKPVHFSIQVQESRLRVWVNAEKKFDLPKALPVTEIFNNLFFRTFSSSYKEDQLGFYIANLKIATGLPDTRHKLVEEGKFSTTGILFDVNAATIKPESAGVLKEIGETLVKHGELKVNIIGHTDSDGSDAANAELSKKRAEAVKKYLEENFKIEASRLSAEGKGDSEPVADNKTKEGKAQNRRVEFIKQ